jgi:hypothetical protein
LHWYADSPAKTLKVRVHDGVEHMACRVPEDPTFPMPAEGYVVSFLAFYELGYTTPSHWFLCSLLLYYGIELHNLTPSMVLHLAAFMNLCEAYLTVDPEFGLLNYFFGVQRPQEPDVELIVSGGRGHSCQVRSWS